MSKNQLFFTYNNLIDRGFCKEYIRLVIYKAFKIDIEKYIHNAEYHRLFRMKEARLDQDTFRSAIVFRDSKCIVSGYDPSECEAAHIVPFANKKSFDPANGILLNRCLHKLFDDYQFTINPDTMKIIIKNPSKNLSIKSYLNKKIKLHTECIPYIKKHYARFMELLD